MQPIIDDARKQLAQTVFDPTLRQVMAELFAKERAIISADRALQMAAEYQEKLKALTAWRQGEIDTINEDQKKDIAWASDKRLAIEQEKSAALKTESERHEAARQAELTPIQGEINQLDVDEKTAAQRAKDSQREAVLRQTVEGHREQLAGLQAQSDGLTKKLEAIGELRKRILANLPIPGVSVRDGQIYREEIPYDRLNTAQQIEIAVAVAKLRAKDLGIVCVDGLECLDEQSFLEFENAMKDTGLQVFVTRVTNKPFEVTTK